MIEYVSIILTVIDYVAYINPEEQVTKPVYSTKSTSCTSVLQVVYRLVYGGGTNNRISVSAEVSIEKNA